MTAQERREELLLRLRRSQEPFSGGRLAKTLGVSRQVIVGDVAMLRASGHEIVSTARGYVLAEVARPARNTNEEVSDPKGAATKRPTRVLKLRHTVEQTSDELFTILENGGTVLDVFVSHRVYGRLRAPLNIATRADALRFLDSMSGGTSFPLLTVTSGYHYHTITADSEATLDCIERALDSKGYLAMLLPHERALDVVCGA